MGPRPIKEKNRYVPLVGIDQDAAVPKKEKPVVSKQIIMKGCVNR